MRAFLRQHVVELLGNLRTLGKVGGLGEFTHKLVEFRVAVTRNILPLPAVFRGRNLVAQPFRQIFFRVRTVEIVGVHFDVGIKFLEGIRARRVTAEEDRSADIAQFGSDADLRPHVLHQFLRGLANRVCGRLVKEGKFHAILGANAIGTLHPAGIVQ